MRLTIEVRRPFALLAVALASGWSTTAAFAACGMAAVSGGASGPPSISTTETSTTQVLEQIRRRTQEAQTQQPIPVSTTADAGTVEPPASEAAAEAQATSSSSSDSSAGSSSSAPKTPKSKPAASQSASPAKTYKQQVATDDYAIAEKSTVYGGSTRTTAVWSQGFLGYERHKNTAPGNQENPTRTAVTGGGLLGADWTHITQSNGVRAVQYGVFSGYSDTHARKSNTFFEVDEAAPSADPPPPQSGGGNTNYFRTNNQEDIDGPFVGAYLAYVRDAWTFDAAFKADFFDLTQSSTLTQRCGDDIGTQTGSASVTNYMIAANTSRRFELTDRHWWEPTAGVRYTYTDFGNDPSNSVFRDGGVQPTGRLGLEDGYAIRLQFGARLGERIETQEGYIWTTTVGAFLYSDVIVNGFDSVSGQTGQFVGPVDEGELRALGQLETRLNVGNGVTYLFQAEVRGGDDVFGAAGQIGIRYEW